jgi:hypothetical protein
MGLAREWLRQTLGASGLAVLAPVALIAAVAVAGFSGGFGQLGGLEQLFGGPSVSLPSAGGTPGTSQA